MFINQKYYENGNRASRLIVFTLKQQASNIIQKLKPDNTVLRKPDKIPQPFAQFYEFVQKHRHLHG